jgi:hypothetical protein
LPTIKRLASPDCSGEARAINNRGLIVGSICGVPSSGHAAMWSSSAALPVELPQPPSGSVRDGISDVNDDGVIIGRALQSEDDHLVQRGILWTKDLTAISLGDGIPLAINASGVIVGGRNGNPVKIEWQRAGGAAN